MRTHHCLVTLLFILAAPVWATEQGVATRGMAQDDWLVYRYHVMWGINTKTKQVWDGSARISKGRILKVDPFIRHDILYDSMLVTDTSWKSTTYMDVEGVFIKVVSPPDAVLLIDTATFDFDFRVDELQPGESKDFLGGDIQVTNKTEEVLFRIAGLEYGKTGKGTATISPREARVNIPGTWVLTYTAPEGGIPVGGGIRVSWHFTRSLGDPQFDDPKGLNYVSVSTTGESRLDYLTPHIGLLEYPFLRGRILVRVLDKPLRAGEIITVTLGDTSEGSPGLMAPWIAEDNLVIRIEDCTEVVEGEFPVYRRLKELPSIKISPGERPDRFFVVAPSQAVPGEPFSVKVAVEDAYRNLVPAYEGALEVLLDGNPIATTTISKSDAGTVTIPDVHIPEPGAWYLVVREKNGSLEGESNPMKCDPNARAERILWGEMHGHTQYSDGYGSGDDYFRFARDRAFLDFAAITDHDVELDAPDFHVAEMWEEVNAAVKRNHDPPIFLTVPAYEWSPARVTISTIQPYGDHNVYYEDEDMPIFQAEHELSNTLPKLYDLLKQVREKTAVQTIPHVGGAVGNWEYHDPLLENLCEVFSVHGSFEAFGEIALQKGYTVGFVGAADSHNGQIGGFLPGNADGHFTHGGLAAVSVPESTRSAILKSMEQRRTYATSGERTWLDFRINGQPMGSVLETDVTPTIQAEVIGTAPILSVEVVKNGQVIHEWTNEFNDDGALTLLWGNRVEAEQLMDFDESLWSYHLRSVNWAGGLKASGWGSKVNLVRTCSFDYPKDTIVSESKGNLAWTSMTRGDWDGVTVQLSRKDMKLNATLGDYGVPIDTGDLAPGLNVNPLGPSDRLLLVKGSPTDRHATLEFADQSHLYRWNYYYVRVLQVNGEMAWSSPIWIRRP